MCTSEDLHFTEKMTFLPQWMVQFYKCVLCKTQAWIKFQPSHRVCMWVEYLPYLGILFWWLENISQLSVSNNWFSHLSCVYLLFKIGWKFLPKRMQLLKWNYKCPCCTVECWFRSIALKKLFYSIVNEIADNTHPRWIRTPEKLCDKMNRPGQVKTSPGILLKVILALFRNSLSLSLFSNKRRYSHILLDLSICTIGYTRSQLCLYKVVQ